MVSNMAKDGVLRGSASSMVSFKAAFELKRELQRLVRAIVHDDDDVAAEDEALKVLCSLKDLKFRKSSSFKLDDNNINLTVPEEFKCPISRELMRDPVILATGLTYDRPFIERWLTEGHSTCPQTQQVLSHSILTPNHLVREMIYQWCSDHGLEPPRAPREPDDERVFRDINGGYLNSLLDKIASSSSSLSDKKVVAKELRMLTKRNPSFRGLLGEADDCIARLVSPISISHRVDDHPDLQEDLITTLLNLSIYENNRGLVTGNESAIALLVESLKSGTPQTKSNAAAALFTLSDTDSNKLIIGDAGAVRPLVELIQEGDPRVMKDAASAIFNLCIVIENKRRAVREGAVPAIMTKIHGNMMVPELLAILALLSVHQKAVEEMEERSVVPLLLGILRESDCETSKENCIAILYTICYNDRVKLREIRAEEATNGTISRLGRAGTSRAKRKANGILERINRAALITHTA